MCKIDSVAKGVARGGVALDIFEIGKICALFNIKFNFYTFSFSVFLDSIYRFAYMILPYMI